MRLLRFGPKGQEKPGCLDADGNIRDLSGITADFAGATVSISALNALRDVDITALPLAPAGTRLGSCIASVPNFLCIGLNYAKHAAESGMRAPSEPVLFSKTSSALSGPFDPVVIPKGASKADWEVELGVLIGTNVEHISQADALSCVAGYCTINDVSERAFQLEYEGQWIKGKSAPTFGPTGPYLVAADEVSNPQNLNVSLKLNGVVQQDSNTSDMIFSIAEIISYMSRFMRLQPGDLIATGTPSGVGMGQKPQRFLKPGDVMEVEVEGLGAQRQDVVAFGA